MVDIAELGFKSAPKKDDIEKLRGIDLQKYIIQKKIKSVLPLKREKWPTSSAEYERYSCLLYTSPSPRD